MKKLIGLSALLFLLGCSITSKLKKKERVRVPVITKKEILPPKRGISPLIRVKIDEAKTFRFSTKKFFRVYRDTLLGTFPPGEYKVRVKKARKVGWLYFGVVGKEKTRESALTRKELLEKGGLHLHLFESGILVETTIETLDTREYLITIGPYRKKRELLSKSPYTLKGIISIPEDEPHGLVELFNVEGKKLLSTQDFFRILPGQNIPQVFTFYAVKEKNNLRKGRKRDLNFTGILEFRVSPKGELYLVNELSIEEYLRGVLPSEMGPEFPIEALKAQAVIARSMVFANWGKKMAYIGKPYDFERDVYFQVYRGITYRSDRTDMAVRLTRGEVLFFNGEVALTPYHSTCGGHTESGSIWGKSEPYLRGVWDTEDVHHLNLKDEEDVKKFIDRIKDAYCSPAVYGNSLRGYSRTYRWQVEYKRGELERIIKKKTGKSFGRLLDIVPIERGTSGRIKKLKIIGTKLSFIITGELNIRRSLSKNYLRSSLFYIEKRGDRFLIKGGGFGHGVGLCQLGAAGRALRGENYLQILSHYYPGTYIKRIY